MNGTRQALEITSDSPVTVSAQEKPAQTTPVILPLYRKSDHNLTLTTESGESTMVVVDHKVNNWYWGNAFFSIYGLAGVFIDFIAGGTYSLALKDSAQAFEDFPANVKMRWISDPRAFGTWHMSLGYFLGHKSFPERTVSSGGGFELGIQLVTGKNDWPIDLIAEGFFISSTWEMENSPTMLLNAGLRKTLRMPDGRLYPYAAGGLTLLSRSTQVGEGFPVGLWSRIGADLRLGQRFFFGPYLGYSKLEMVASSNAVNTAGLTGGLVFGMMW